MDPADTRTTAGTGAPPVARLVGVTIAAARIDELAHFYRGVVGAVLTAHEDGGVRFFRGTAGDIELQIFPKEVARISAVENLHQLRFAVADLDAAVNAVRAAGGELQGDVIVGPLGRLVCVRDPDGNTVELVEPARTPIRRR